MAKAEKVVTNTETTPADMFDAHFEAGIRVTYAFLHQTLSGPGIPAERSISQQKMPNGEFRWTNMGLLIKYKTYRIGIPSANVSNWYI